MEERLYLYPSLIRIWHFINAILILVLIFSGVSMQYSDPLNPILRFDIAVSLHNFSGILLTLSYFIFIIGNINSGNYRHYKIKLKGFGDRLKKQFRYYTYGMFKNMPPPFPVTKKSKFNPIQQITYFLVMFVLVPLLFISGLLLLYSGTFIRELFGNRVLFYTDILHIVIGFFVSIFLIIHIYFCTIGSSPSANFKSMITGYHEGH